MGSEAAALLEAADFAARKHKGQRRKDPEGTPYINHPIGAERGGSPAEAARLAPGAAAAPPGARLAFEGQPLGLLRLSTCRLPESSIPASEAAGAPCHSRVPPLPLSLPPHRCLTPEYLPLQENSSPHLTEGRPQRFLCA